MSARLTGRADIVHIFLRTEKAFRDSSTGTGIAKEGHGAVGIFDADLQRGAQLVTVERPMTGFIEPLRLARAIIAGPARIEILVAAVGRELHRHIGIPLARGEAVTKADDEEILHRDFCGNPLLARDSNRNGCTLRVRNRGRHRILAGCHDGFGRAYAPFAIILLQECNRLARPQLQFDFMGSGHHIILDTAAGAVVTLLCVPADIVDLARGPAHRLVVAAQNAREGNVAVIEHVLAADHGSGRQQPRLFVVADGKLVDMDAVLPPGPFM